MRKLAPTSSLPTVCQISWEEETLQINNLNTKDLALLTAEKKRAALETDSLASEAFPDMQKNKIGKVEGISLKVNYEQLKGYFCISHLLDKSWLFINTPEYKLSCKAFKMPQKSLILLPS